MGGKKGQGLRPLDPQNGGSWRRWAVSGLQRPGVHCRPPHWLALAVTGAPAEAQRSTRFGGERRPSGGNELSGLPGSERSVAWADDAAPRAARIGITLQALKTAALYQLGPPGRRRCCASEISRKSWQLSVGRDDPARPRGFPGRQATTGRPYIVGPSCHSLPRKRESSFPPLGLLLPTPTTSLGRRGGPIGFTESSRPTRPAVSGTNGRMISAPTGTTVTAPGRAGHSAELHAALHTHGLDAGQGPPKAARRFGNPTSFSRWGN